MRWGVRGVLAIALACGLAAGITSAQSLSGGLNIIQANSSLTVSGNLAGSAFSAQLPGSLVSSYTGSIQLGFDLGANTIQFTGGSTIDASVFAGGNLQPLVGGGAGAAPADYGISTTVAIFPVLIAVRSFVGDLTSGSIAMSGGPVHSFGSGQTFTLASGSADYNAGAVGSGNAPLASLFATNTGANGTLEELGGNLYRVTVPVAVTINTSVQSPLGALPIVINVNGSLQAQGVLIAVPEPTTLALLGLAGLGGAYTGFRRLRQRNQVTAALNRYNDA